jgi:hypothetical protein
MTHITDHLSVKMKIFPKVKGRREKKRRGETEKRRRR